MCALDSEFSIVAVVDGKCESACFAGAPMQCDLDAVAGAIDAVPVTVMRGVEAVRRHAVDRFGAERVLVQPQKQRSAA
jgi:hypothetical protein